MPFWKCNNHVIWATKHRQLLITPPMEIVLFETIRVRSDELHCPVFGVNGTSDHIHVAVNIRPSVAVGDWVGQIKGASSRAINMAFEDLETKFRWQEDYGIVTFGAKNLPTVLGYIEHQKEHHQAGTLEAYLERAEE